MRDRLIKILEDAGKMREFPGSLANILIENGVTIPNRGHWINRGEGSARWVECSYCHVCGSPQWNVCPVCETKMEVNNG